MTVRGLINELMNCPMDAEVNVAVELHKDFVNEQLKEYGGYTFPIASDVNVEGVSTVCDSRIRIILVNTSYWDTTN